MIKKLLFISFILVNLQGFSRELPDFERFTKILGILESNENDLAIGDHGKSISRYQIQKACYLDAKEYDKSIVFSYESLTNKLNAARIVKAYCMRYEKQACLNGDFEILARLWNSGPGWRDKKSKTNKYVIKFNNIARQNK